MNPYRSINCRLFFYILKINILKQVTTRRACTIEAIADDAMEFDKSPVFEEPSRMEIFDTETEESDEPVVKSVCKVSSRSLFLLVPFLSKLPPT